MPMSFHGSVQIDAPREDVYAFLTDPRKVSECAADVQSVEVLDEDAFKVVARAGVGFVKATFALQVTWLERTAPSVAKARARGSAPGSAVDMVAAMDMTDSDGGTRLDWTADVTVSGAIAGVGARLLQGAADKITSQTFACVKQTLEASTPATA